MKPRPSLASGIPAPTPSTVTPPGLFVVGERGADVAADPGGEVSAKLRANVILPFEAVEGSWARVTTPCENRGWVKLHEGISTAGAKVVIDPGHGGDESGALGPSGLSEKDLNLDIARRTAAQLVTEGIETVLARNDDYRATIAFRVMLAQAVRPETFVSIHHNADPDGSRTTPGTETFYQFHSPASKRLAGLIYEEVFEALGHFSANWVGDSDAGAKWRTNSRGTDYYGILRHSAAAGINAVLAEMAFISNPSEEKLLKLQDVRAAEAAALSRAIVRFLTTDEPGSGFTTPYPRTAPAGPGGGRAGCLDPTAP